jgi:hypothetical protein
MSRVIRFLVAALVVGTLTASTVGCQLGGLFGGQPKPAVQDPSAQQAKP